MKPQCIDFEVGIFIYGELIKLKNVISVAFNKENHIEQIHEIFFYKGEWYLEDWAHVVRLSDGMKCYFCMLPLPTFTAKVKLRNNDGQYT